MNRFSFAVVVSAMILAGNALSQNAAAQPGSSQPPVIGNKGKSAAGVRNQQKIRELEKRVEKLEKELAKYAGKNSLIPADPKKQKILTLLESPYFGSSSYSSNGQKFFVARLLIINLTTKAITVKPDGPWWSPVAT